MSGLFGPSTWGVRRDAHERGGSPEEPWTSRHLRDVPSLPSRILHPFHPPASRPRPRPAGAVAETALSPRRLASLPGPYPFHPWDTRTNHPPAPQPAIRLISFDRHSATRVDTSTTAIPPFFIATLAPVSRPTSAEKTGSCPTSNTSPRPAAR